MEVLKREIRGQVDSALESDRRVEKPSKSEMHPFQKVACGLM